MAGYKKIKAATSIWIMFSYPLLVSENVQGYHSVFGKLKRLAC